MSGTQLYGTTGDYAVDGYYTQWKCPVPGPQGFRVVGEVWTVDEKNRPVRQITAYTDAGSGALVGAP